MCASVAIAASSPARAGLIVSVSSVSAAAGSTGDTLEVDVTNTGAPVDIAAFGFEISVPAASGVTFTGADDNTTANIYIFAGNSAFGPNIGMVSMGGTQLDGTDIAAAGSTTLGTGATLGLGNVFFDVSSMASPGPVTVTLVPDPGTTLTDPNQGNISIDTLNNGTITITGGTTVPEPSALISATLGLLGGAWLVRSRLRN